MNDDHLGGSVTAAANCSVLSMNQCVYMHICDLLQHSYHSYMFVVCSEQLVVVPALFLTWVRYRNDLCAIEIRKSWRASFACPIRISTSQDAISYGSPVSNKEHPSVEGKEIG